MYSISIEFHAKEIFLEINIRYYLVWKSVNLKPRGHSDGPTSVIDESRKGKFDLRIINPDPRNLKFDLRIFT